MLLEVDSTLKLPGFAAAEKSTWQEVLGNEHLFIGPRRLPVELALGLPPFLRYSQSWLQPDP